MVDKVTILMNTWNEHQEYLRQAIDSCLAQELVEVQLIICSVEGDKNIQFITRNYPKVELLIMPLAEHPGRGVKGCYSQINFALPHVRGNWFHFISSNDVLHHDKCIVEIQLCKSKGKKVCYSNFNHMDRNGTVYTKTNVGEYSFERHMKGNFVSDASMIGVDLLKKYTPFNTDLNNFAFWDMWLRIYEGEGDVFVYNPDPIFNYRVMRNSMHIQRRKDPEQVEKTKQDRENMLNLHR